MKHQETKIHQAVVSHLKLRGVAGLVYFHCPMGIEAASKFQGALAKSMGARRGVSDLILVHDSKIFCLELKSQGGRITEPQMEFLADMEREGAFCAIAYGLDEALKTLVAWSLLKGAVSA